MPMTISSSTWVAVGGKVAFGMCFIFMASVSGISGHLGGDARAEEDEPPGPIEEVVVVGEPIEEELTWLDHMEVREWLAGAVGEIQEEIELEMGRVTLCGDEGCALASLLDWLIASIEDDVSEMGDCIRDRLSKRDRDNSSPHRFEYEIGATAEAATTPRRAPT